MTTLRATMTVSVEYEVDEEEENDLIFIIDTDEDHFAENPEDLLELAMMQGEIVTKVRQVVSTDA